MSQYSLLNRSPYLAPTQPVFMPDLLGPLELVTAPTGLAVSLEEAKTQCRQEEDDGASILGLINAAQDYVESDGSRTLLATTFDVPVLTWWQDELQLPRPPLQSLAWVKYYDAGGTLTTLDSSFYEVRKPWKQPGGIIRQPQQTWPALQVYRKYPISIRFTAGFADADSVPALIKQAMLLLIEHWYDERAATGEPLAAADRLLSLAGWGSYK